MVYSPKKLASFTHLCRYFLSPDYCSSRKGRREVFSLCNKDLRRSCGSSEALMTFQSCPERGTRKAGCYTPRLTRPQLLAALEKGMKWERWHSSPTSSSPKSWGRSSLSSVRNLVASDTSPVITRKTGLWREAGAYLCISWPPFPLSVTAVTLSPLEWQAWQQHFQRRTLSVQRPAPWALPTFQATSVTSPVRHLPCPLPQSHILCTFLCLPPQLIL